MRIIEGLRSNQLEKSWFPTLQNVTETNGVCVSGFMLYDIIRCHDIIWKNQSASMIEFGKSSLLFENMKVFFCMAENSVEHFFFFFI